jgi:hypothetical protein
VARRALCLLLYRSDEAIAATGHRGDDPLPATTVPDSVTYQPETLTQCRLAYILLRPERLEDLCL